MAHEGRLWRRHTTLYAHVACGGPRVERLACSSHLFAHALSLMGVCGAHTLTTNLFTHAFSLCSTRCVCSHICMPPLPDHRHCSLLQHLGRGRGESQPHARVLMFVECCAVGEIAIFANHHKQDGLYSLSHPLICFIQTSPTYQSLSKAVYPKLVAYIARLLTYIVTLLITLSQR